MALKFYESNDMTAIANAIRAKNGSSDTYRVADMAAAIEALPDKSRAILEGTVSDLVSEASGVRSFCFYNYTGLQTVNLQNATTIGERAFGGCSNLEEVVLGAVTSITYLAFSYCTKLTDLVLDVDAVPTLVAVSAFQNTPISDGTGSIWITDELVEELKGSTNWSNFASIIKPLSERSA